MAGGLEFKTLRLAECKASADGSEFEGLASAFYCIDDSWWNDIVAPGAFREDLPEFLERGFVGGMNHDWCEPIGRPLHAEETEAGLFVRASVCETQHGRDVRTLLKDGVVRFLSIGFRALAKQRLETAEEVAAWWKSAGYSPTPEDVAKSQFGARLLTRIQLFEFSPVVLPANRGAMISAVKGESPAWASLVEHSEAVLATVEEWVERVEGLRGLRQAEGRGLSPDHRTGLKRLRTRIDGLLGALDEHRGAGTREGDEAAALYEEFTFTGARLRGAGLITEG